MASRRSRLKVLPNLGGRNNREGNATTENKSAASVTAPKSTINGTVTENSVKSTPESVASSSNSAVDKTQPSKKDGLVNNERDSEIKSSELNDSSAIQITENVIAKDEKVLEEDTLKRTQSNEVYQSEIRISEQDVGHNESCVSKTPDRPSQDKNNSKEIKTNDSIPVSNEIKSSSEVKEPGVESNDTAISEDSELQIIENSPSKEVVNEPTKKLPIRGAPRRFMKAKPNLLEAGRRNSLKVPSSNKEAEEIIKLPPVVHRIANIQERITEKATDTKGTTRKNSDIDCSNGVGVEKEKSTEEVESIASSVELTSVEPKPTNKSSRTQASSSNHQSRNRTQSKNYDKEEVFSRRNTTRNKKCPPDRSKMTMFDLIYWNPTSNPMVYHDEAESVQPLPEDKDKTEEDNILAPTEEEERVDNGEDEQQQQQEEENPEAESMPGPRVKIGPDGSIILDEQSLVIETTASKNNTVSESPIVYEKSSNTTYSSFRNKRRHKNWSDKETMKFYKALSTVGTDFSLMANLFPKRTRDELKLKFKKEERSSKDLVDKAVRERQQFDLSIFDNDDDEEEEENSPTNKQIAKKVLNTRRKRPKLSEDNSNIQENYSPMKPGSNVSGNPPLVKRRSRKRKLAVEESSDSDKRSDNFSSNDSKGTYDALIFDIENPVKSSRKANKKDILNNKEEESSPESKNGKAKENEETIDVSGSDSHDSEIEVLSNIRRPTRSGRQPKQRNIFTIEEKAKRQRRRAQLSASPVVSAVTVTSTTGNLTSTPPTVVATQLQNILLSHPALSGLASSPDTAQNRLIFVPSPSSEQGTQVINVYMLSPANTSRSPAAPFSPTQQIVSPTLGRPSPVVRASPEGLTTSPQIQLSTHGRVIQAIRTPTRIFLPNLAAAANRPSQVRSPGTQGSTASSSPCLHKLLSTPPSEPLQKPAVAPANTPVEASTSTNETSLHSAESSAETQNPTVVVQAVSTNNSTTNVYPTITPSSSECTETVQVMQVRNMSPQNTKYLIILPQKPNQEANNVGRISTKVRIANNSSVSVAAAVSETNGLVAEPTNVETVSAASMTTQKNPDAIQVLQV